MRYFVAIGLVFAVLAAAGCSNGMGKGTQVMAAPAPPPPPPPPPPPTTVESSGMGKGTAVVAPTPPPPPPTTSVAARVTCRVTAVHRPARSFLCRMHGHSLRFYMTGNSEVRSGGRIVRFRALRAGQDVRVRYFRDHVRTVDRVTILH